MLSAAALLVSLGCQQQHLTLVLQEEHGKTIDDTPAPRDAHARAAAAAMVESLNEEQRAGTVLPLTHEAREDWHFVPRRRRGVSLGDMTLQQRVNLHELMQTGLSDSGYLKAMGIVWTESILQEMENGNPGRDPGKYHLLIFGDPTNEDGGSAADWGWRFEGHHLSLNFTYAEEGTAVTPMFMGAAPAVIPTGLHAGQRVLADEHNLAFAFIETLTDEQREQMMIGDEPGDVITMPGREDSLNEPMGISTSDLITWAQIDALLELTHAYRHRLKFGQAIEMQEEVLADWKHLHFAWAGSTNPDEPHYYRIHYKDKFVIEYCTRDGGVNHVHGVFHDLTDPLARDLLREHFEQHHGEE